MYCRNCGTPFDGNFCPNCGTPSDASARAQAQEPQYDAQRPETKPPTSVIKQWWFWALLAVTLIALFITSQMLIPERGDVADSSVEAEIASPETQVTEAPAALPPVSEENPDSTEPGDSASSLPSVAETVLVDQDGIRIVATGLSEEEWYGPCVNVLVENSSAYSVSLSVSDVSVNGAMMMPVFYCEVASGKKANEIISFDQASLDKAGITTIQSIDMKFVAYESESYDTVLDSDIVTLRTDAKNQAQTFDDSGSVALDQGGVRVIVRGIENEDSDWGTEVAMYLENHTGRDITVQMTDVSINGFMMDPYFYCDLLDGKVAYYSATFLKDDLDKNGIDSINSLECSFTVYEKNSFDTLFKSDPVTIKFPS